MISKTDRVICGTCQFWTGKRAPSFDKKGIPKVDIVDKIGNCENENSQMCGKERSNQLKCKHFSKWTEIL